MSLNLKLGWALGLLLLAALSAQAEEGRWREVNENKCGRCHRVYAPEEFSRSEWNRALLSMKARSGLDEDEFEGLASLAVDESEQTSPLGSGPRLGGYLYTEYFQSPQEVKNYDIHYLAVHLTGWAGEQVEYLGEFEFEHGGRGDNAFVEQAWMDYWFMPNIGLRIGAMLTPFNRFDEIHDPLSNPLVTRPQMARELGVSAWKEAGVDLHGYLRLNKSLLMDFDLYSINGLGSGANLRGSRQYRDNNEDKGFGARASFVVADAYELGLSGYRGAWDDESEYELRMLGVHARLRTPLADLHAEYTSARSENPEPTGEGVMSGYFIQAVRELHPKFRVVARWGALDYLDPGMDLGRDPAKGDKDLNELSLGLSFSPSPQVIFKLEYSINGEGDRHEEIDNDQLGLQAAVSF
jgi:hypothetical protein